MRGQERQTPSLHDNSSAAKIRKLRQVHRSPYVVGPGWIAAWGQSPSPKSGLQWKGYGVMHGYLVKRLSNSYRQSVMPL